MYNRPNHLEIPVLDTEKAKEFFSIFGWKDHYMDFEPGRYTLVNGPEGDNPVSFGFYKVDKIPASGVRIVLGVEDIEQKLKEVEAAGGKITREKYEIAPEV